uniref:GATA-type domain-containing protein n=1 Tax=Salix viminalis TaxID=40686 RepID=A0A6N2LKT8_SALVM
MLYQTHLFSSPKSTALSLLSFSYPLRFRFEKQEMEYVEGALKTSFGKEMAVKFSPQVFDDFWAVNVPNGMSSDDFSVDKLLDFSNENDFLEEEEEEGDKEKPCVFSASASPKQEALDEDKSSDSSPSFAVKDDFFSVPTSELCVPTDDFASLEWLSHFVEDSNSEYAAPFPASFSPPEPHKENPDEQEKAVLEEPCFKTPVPGKARSKRTRNGVRVWPLGSPSLTESSSSSSSISSSSPSNPWLIYSKPGSKVEPVWFEKPVAKKMKRNPADEAAASGGGGTSSSRRCSHCGVQKTPQWRAGPNGSKTLCNACGVRYKSGRLLPEYRPACSPTFSKEVHSNHHRKVLEMRRKKEGPVQTEPGLVQPFVPSLG